MAVGQPTRPKYQRVARSHQTPAGGSYMANPPDSIPTGNVPIFVPRQDDTSFLSSLNSDGGGSFAPPSETSSPSESLFTPQTQPPSTSTSESSSTGTPSSWSPSPSTSSATPPPTTSTRNSLTDSVPPSMSSPPPVTSSPTQPFGFLNSSSLTYSPDTTITSPVVLTVNGSPTTSFVLVPTTLSNPDNVMTSSQRTAVVAGSIAGGLAFFVLVVAIVLFYRRHQNKKKGFFPTSEPKPRTMLLAGEDLDDDYGYSRQSSNAPTPLPPSIRRVDSPISTIPRSDSVDQSPRLLRPRASDTGSIFHEGGIWPPPGDGSRLVDPILAGSNINLFGIVDDVMGSFTSQQHNTGNNAVFRPRGGTGETATIQSDRSIYSTDLPVFVPNQGQGHSRGASANSDMSLIPPEPLYLASVHNSGSSPSILPPRYESGLDPSRSSTSISNPHGTRNWLDRSPRKISESPTDPFNRNPSPSITGNGR